MQNRIEASKEVPLAYSVSKRSSFGIMLLIFRQIIVQGMNFSGGILLARFLSIEDYGFYGIVFFLFAFLNNFGDIGLGASIIKNSNEPNQDDFHTIFSAQVVLTLLASLVFLWLIPHICELYGLSQDYSVYFYIIVLSFSVMVFRVIPTVTLERHLDFKWLTVSEIIQAFTYNFLACFLAYHNWGPYSFTLALFARALIGVLIINFLKPTKYRFKLKWLVLKKHLKFGLPYQLAVFVNMLKDSFSPVIIGLILGINKTGIVNMASTVAGIPIMLLFILNRLFFPAFSRAINNKRLLHQLIKLSIRSSNIIVAVLSIFILINVNDFIVLVFGDKWLVSKELFYFLWSANLFLPTSSVCMCINNAAGQPKINLKISILWMIITIGLGVPLLLKYGIFGFGIANIVANISSVVLFYTSIKITSYNFVSDIFIGWLPAIILSPAVIFISRHTYEMNILTFAAIFAGYLVGSIFLFSLLSINEITEFWKNGNKFFFNPKSYEHCEP
ncbi:oligosaccharide flippase family protein [Chitinispirillales bacterium ANBcel5]|uniref:oligosaccharide flippase family protein n=1 Tax=Cellulosispirillum alkaliphilum TaxID=3039283 RepID=UPI002A591A9B|nr:oligosaccharide flippase family protein [Chitinispirillales bacterium ANBcel5]